MMQRRLPSLLFTAHIPSAAAVTALVGALLFTANDVGMSTEENPAPDKMQMAPEFEVSFQDQGAFIPDSNGALHRTTLDSELQIKLQAFVSERGSPISSVVVTDINTGHILAMVQGRSPARWGATTHTALHARFPAASLFKTIVTAAALEMTPTSPDQNFGLQGGCGGQDILPKGDWINDERGQGMTLRRAYGHSCNSFFAKLAINQLGLGTITHYAKSFGWDQQLPSDFALEPSRMLPPGAANSTTHTVGRFAAGFGHVSISPMHANWIAMAIANRGRPRPLLLFADSDTQKVLPDQEEPILRTETAARLLDVMKSTVHDGTASSVFGRGRYRSVAQETGGKTGTLKGRTPTGLTTLFFGVYPLSRPQIAVSSIVVLEDHYAFKASQLAAEAIVNWRDIQDQRNGIIHSASFEEKPVKRPRRVSRSARRR